MSDLLKSLEIIEVGPRDGLRIELHIPSTSEKRRMIDALAEAGLNEIEAGPFVNFKAVPQMANTNELFNSLTGARTCAKVPCGSIQRDANAPSQTHERQGANPPQRAPSQSTETRNADHKI
jgi:isopropylmalate/homocitrate/citramalate synthase